MAQRIKLLCLGATMAPYTGYNLQTPSILSKSVSQYFSFGTDQLQLGADTSTSDRTNYPFALSQITVKYVQANHFQTATFFVTSTQDQINTAANS